MNWTTAALQAVVRQTVYRMLPYAVVDINGWGRYHTIQDAIDADHKWIVVKSGTYPPFNLASGRDNVKIEGSGGRSCIVDNASDTSVAAAVIAGAGYRISDMCFYTATGGAGGGQNAVTITGSAGWFFRCMVLDADLSAFSCTGQEVSFHQCEVLDSDGNGFYLNGARAMLVGCISQAVSGAGTAFYADSAADNSLFVANHSHATMVLAAGADNSVGVANITDGGFTNSSTGSTAANNEQY